MGIKVIVFLDALDPRKASGFLKEIQQAKYLCHKPCVTPTMLGSILTGKSPGEHGLISPTRLDKPTRMRPLGETILERVDQRMRVVCNGIPFTAGVELVNGAVGAGGMDNGGPPALPALAFPPLGINMGYVNPEMALQTFMDSSSALFANLRQIIRNNVADAYFIGFRNLDSFTHWFQGEGYYERLEQHLGGELAAFMCMGKDIELFVFSDHGSMPAHEVFRINRWFYDMGYLDFQCLWGKHDKKIESAKAEGNPYPYEHQIGPYTQYVELINTKFVNSDAFDACVETVGEVSEEEVKKVCSELMETGYFDSVQTREEIYPDLTDEQYDLLPKIIPYRKPGVLVSSNIHTDLPIVGFTDHAEVINRRDGDHWVEGYVGSTTDLGIDHDLIPEELFGLMDDFCGEGIVQEEHGKQLNEAEEAKFNEVMENLGYA